MKSKPVVRYVKSTLTFCGEKSTLRYKRTLLATIKGPEAKALRDSSENGHYWSYDDKKQILRIYKEELLDD